MTFPFPEPLIERIGAGNVVVCSGVGLASVAQMPSWEALLRDLANRPALSGEKRDLEALIERGKLLTVAGVIKRKLGAAAVAEALSAAYAKSTEPSATHRWLHRLPFFAAISTGYDGLVEQALRDREEPKVFTYADGATLRLQETLQHYVLKAHGRPDQPEGLIFSLADFKRQVALNQPYRALLEEIYRTRTLLLIGYQLNDPDFILLMDRLIADFPEPAHDHYAILPRISEAEAEELYANYRLRVVPFEPGDLTTGLGAALKGLKDAFQQAGGKVEAVEDPVSWLQSQLAALDVRVDVVAGQGLTLTRARLQRIDELAQQVDLAQLGPETLCRLGNVRLALGEVSAGIECYSQALALRPDDPVAHLNLHHAMAEVRDFERSLAHLQDALSAAPEMRVLPPRFEVKAVIGRGTTGTVYSARDREGNQAVTVKVLRSSLVREHISAELWLEEVRPLIGLESPHIAKVIDAFVDGGRCVLVSESLLGRSLDRTVREDGPLPAERAAEVIAQLCAALGDAHGHGIVHLDVMPSNVFLRDDGTVALMDFRSGRAGRGRVVAVARGSDGFRAPELLAGEGADVRSDVYSVGATLYYAVTGRRPAGSFLPIREINAGARRFDRLVCRAMQAIPDERPATIEVFARELAGSVGGVAQPDNETDLSGWLEVLAYQPDHSEARRVLDALSGSYREAKDWDNLITLMLGRVEVAPNHGARLESLREVAKVFEEEVGDLAKAFTALVAAFKEDHGSLEIQQDLERLAGATGLWTDLVNEYSQVAQAQREPRQGCEWWVRIGRLYLAKLHHEDYAIAAFQHAISLEANHPEALAELATVYKERKDYAEYAKLLKRLVKQADGDGAKINALLELADAQAALLKDEQEASRSYAKVLELAPAQPDAIAALAALHRRGEQWDALVELLQRAIYGASNDKERAAYRHQLAAVLGAEREDREGAIEQLSAIVAADPDDVKALQALEGLYDATGRHDAYLEVLNKRINAAKDDAEKIALYRRLAEEAQKQSGALAASAEYLTKIHELGGADEETYRTLVQIHWEVKDYPALSETYRWHIAIAERAEDRGVLYGALARVYEQHLDDPAAAKEAYLQLVDLDPKSKIALAGLARLYAAEGASKQAFEALERLEALEAEPAEKVAVFGKMAALLSGPMGRADDARALLLRALELDGAHVGTLAALAELYEAGGDHQKAVRSLQEAAAQATNELEKVQLLWRAGELCSGPLSDDARALENYQQLLDIDPEHVEAGARAAALYTERQAYVQALPLLEMLARKVALSERKRRFTCHLELAAVAAKVDDREKAERAYQVAYDLDPSSIPAAAGLAGLRFEKGELPAAGKIYQALLVHGRDKLGDELMVQAYLRLSAVRRASGEAGKADSLLEKALELAPADPAVLAAAIARYEERADWANVLRCKEYLLATQTEDQQRIDLVLELAELLAKKLGRKQDALARYREALAARADDRHINHQVMELEVALGRWEEAVAAIDRLLEGEMDLAHCHRLHVTAALIYRDELDQAEEAASRFEAALDADPTKGQTFSLLRDLLREQKAFKRLARAYRRMLQRLPEDWPTEERVALWRELADLAQTETKDPREAIIALEMLAKLGHQDSEGADKLARLYATAGPGAFDKAVDVNQRLLDKQPLNKDAYHELFRIYRERGERDKAFCVAAVLSLLRGARTEERALFEAERPRELRYATRKMSDNRLWREHIHHADQVPVLSEMLSIVGPLFTPMAIREREDIKLRSDEQLQPQDDNRTYARVFRYVCEVLEVSPNELYLRPGRMPLALQAVEDEKTQAQVLFVDPSLLDGGERETIFHFGRTLSLMRQEHSVLYLTPTPTVIQALALASLRLTNPEFPLRGDVAVIHRLAAVFAAELPANLVDALAKRYDALVEACEMPQVERWMRAVELSIDRAGLLLCDDLETAARLAASTEPLAIEEGLTAKARAAQLFRYAASESYFEARKRLGLALS